MKTLKSLLVLLLAVGPLRLNAQQVPPDSGGLSLIPGVTPDMQVNILLSVLTLLLIFIARRGVLAVVNQRVEDSAVRYRWAKVTANIAFLLSLLLLVQLWFTAIQSVGTFLGLLSAGLAFALKDLVADLAGWAFIMWRQPFDLGDRIQIGPHAGDVVDRRIFQFTIMEIGNWVDADQSTGRLIHIPNATLFTTPLANYIAGFPYLWNELKVQLTFESNWQKGKQLLGEIAKDLTVDITREAHEPTKRGQQRFLIHYRKLTPVVYVSVADSGVVLTLRYLCRPRERRGTAGQLWEEILAALEQHDDLALAYPTQRVNLSREPLAGRGPEEDVEGDPEPGV
jgi:small-conductance mechanosensitive channel